MVMPPVGGGQMNRNPDPRTVRDRDYGASHRACSIHSQVTATAEILGNKFLLLLRIVEEGGEQQQHLGQWA